jgi:hypothetical protein
MNKDELFRTIVSDLQNLIREDDITQLQTVKGETQKNERQYKELVSLYLDSTGLAYSEAHSQKSGDFVVKMDDGEELVVECKKTDSGKIMLNDTLPSRDKYYLIFYTAKNVKSRKAQIFGCRGDELIDEDSQWIYDYLEELSKIKERYSRDFCVGNITCYPRPNFSCNIRKKFLTSGEPVL